MLSAVAQLKPNDFGLFDMHGNVWEWTNSAYSPYPDKEGRDDAPSSMIQSHDEMILRGGACVEAPEYVRSACPYKNVAGEYNRYFGFRAVRTLRAD
jgi:formylglycine-generating enzyme required for sulfatase activity